MQWNVYSAPKNYKQYLSEEIVLWTKKMSYYKTFKICTTHGYIIDMLRPFKSDETDAIILKHVISDPYSFSMIIKPGDKVIVAGEFGDIVPELLLHQKQRKLTIWY